MIPVNISDNFVTNDQTLHLETQFRPNQAFIIQTLYSQGQILSKINYPIPNEKEEQSLKKIIYAKHDESLRVLKFLFQIDQKIKFLQHIKSLVYLGDLYIKWGLTDHAIQVFKIAIQNDFNSIEAVGQLGKAYNENNQTEKTIALLSEYLRPGANHANLFLIRGQSYLQLKQYEEAFSDFKRSNQLQSKSWDANLYLALSSIYMVSNQLINKDISSSESGVKCCTIYIAEAMKHLDLLTRKDIEPILQYLKDNKFEKAISTLLKLIHHVQKLYDLDFHRLFYLHFLYGKNGRDSKVVKQYIQKMESLIRQFPHSHELRMNLGIGYVIQCRELYQKALHEFYYLRDQSEGKQSIQKMIENADQLSMHFFQFIKGLMK